MKRRALSIVLLLFIGILPARTSQAGLLVHNGDSICFIGDSITEFGSLFSMTFQGRAIETRHGYINLFLEALTNCCGISNITVYRKGVAGNDTDDLLARLNRDCLSLHPTFVTGTIGFNDVWNNWKGTPYDANHVHQNLLSFWSQVHTAGITPIVITPTVKEDQAATSDMNQMLTALSNWEKTQCTSLGYTCIDLNTTMESEIAARRTATGWSRGNLLTYDGVHMDYYGDCMVAWELLKAFGVDNSKKNAVYAHWAKLPGLVMAHGNGNTRISVTLTQNEYNTISAAATAKGYSDVSAYCKEIITRNCATPDNVIQLAFGTSSAMGFYYFTQETYEQSFRTAAGSTRDHNYIKSLLLAGLPDNPSVNPPDNPPVDPPPAKDPQPFKMLIRSATK